MRPSPSAFPLSPADPSEFPDPPSPELSPTRSAAIERRESAKASALSLLVVVLIVVVQETFWSVLLAPEVIQEILLIIEMSAVAGLAVWLFSRLNPFRERLWAGRGWLAYRARFRTHWVRTEQLAYCDRAQTILGGEILAFEDGAGRTLHIRARKLYGSTAVWDEVRQTLSSAARTEDIPGLERILEGP